MSSADKKGNDVTLLARGEWKENLEKNGLVISHQLQKQETADHPGIVDALDESKLYDPADPGASPYGGTIVNSYCHAWSCAPAYFLRTFFQ